MSGRGGLGWGQVHAALAFALLAALPPPAAAQTRLTVAAFPSVDKIVEAAIPAWKKLHPNIEVHVVSRQSDDHHTAMTTALSTSFYLPDVMAIEVGYVGRFAQGGGLEDLSREPYRIRGFESLYVPYAFAQATSRNGAVVAAPTDIGPGTLLYRTDIIARAGVSEADLTKSWDGYVDAGIRIKATTGAYLLAHAREMKDILIRIGIRPGEGLYFDKDSRVLVNSPRFVRAFELARKVRQNKLDARVSAWSTEWSEGFKRGTLATQMSGAWLAGHLSNWVAPATKGAWRAAQLPEGAWAAFGGTFFAIARGAPTACSSRGPGDDAAARLATLARVDALRPAVAVRRAVLHLRPVPARVLALPRVPDLGTDERPRGDVVRWPGQLRLLAAGRVVLDRLRPRQRRPAGRVRRRADRLAGATGEHQARHRDDSAGDPVRPVVVPAHRRADRGRRQVTPT
jgi:multiple sugar transport system substrate-binding protein